MRGFFVTGSDTGVGKTFVSAAILVAVRAAGRRCLGYKPIETGCAPGDRAHPSGLVGDDGEALAVAAGDWQRGVERGAYRLPVPAAPAEAARRAGVVLDLGVAFAPVRAFVGDFAIVEGAGGWRVPVTDGTDTSELARRSGLPVVLVGRGGLGTINHTLLSVEAIRRDGLTVAAIVLSIPVPVRGSTHDPDAARLVASNMEWIASRAGTAVLRTDEAGWEGQLTELRG